MNKEDEEGEKLKISRKPSSASNFEAPDGVANEINNILSGSGSSLDCSAAEFMESRFGYDFSNVKIHTGEMRLDLLNQLMHWLTPLVTILCLEMENMLQIQ